MTGAEMPRMFAIRELLAVAKIPVPDGAVSYHTESLKNPRKLEIVFQVPGSPAVRSEITSDQHAILYQQQAAGSFGWDIEPQH